MDEKFVCQLKEELKQIDVELTERQIEQFYNYYELLIHWNSMINLTAITQLDEVVTKHFVDSLSLKKIIVDIGQKSQSLIDVGTGAGFPGIRGSEIMKVTLITVGKIKEKFFQDAIAEYSKRLSRYCKLEIVQVADEKTPDGASEAVETQIKEKEGERILSNIKDGSFVVALAINGNMLDSEELAAKIEKWGVSGISQIVFIIGGSLGLSNQVLARADYKLSFSKMTFPHQLMRVILLEQIYRSYRIIQGEPYHK